jgi:prepilin-type N-terminal cleavage/methylation domain-containing protein
MKRFRDSRGFSIFELITVMAVMGVMVAIAMPMMTSYKRKEDTRGAAQKMSSVVTEARARAISSGRMTFLLLGEPTNGIAPFEPGQVAALVMDDDGDNAITEADPVSPIHLPVGINADISMYGVNGTPLGSFAIPTDDLSEAVASGNLSTLTNGTTLPVSADLGVPVVAFSPQGAPVAVDTPAEWGTGAGGIYVTDNANMVLAVLIAPLGSVKVEKLDPADGNWK